MKPAARDLPTAPPAPAQDLLTDQTVLERRSGVAAAFETREGAVAIVTSYDEIQGPPSIGPALQFVCRHRLLRVGHLPGLRDEASRRVLAGRLIRAGFLRVSADQTAAPAAAVPEDQDAPAPGQGCLVVAGSGIKGFAQMTVETLGWLDRADVVMHCVSDPATGAWIRHQYPDSIDLAQLYDRHTSRFDVYDEMVETMLKEVRAGKLVCSLYYGHPGVFVMPTHRAIRLAREEGHQAFMLAGVSATDCLYAELGSDPSAAGCQYYEATDMLVHRRPLHPENNVVIWQVGLVGNTTSSYAEHKLPILLEYLFETYSPDCEVLHYQGSVFPGCDSVVERLPLRELGQGAKLSSMSTLYIPAQNEPAVDLQMAWRLGLVTGAPGEEKADEKGAGEKGAGEKGAGEKGAEGKDGAPAAVRHTRRQPEFGSLAQLFYELSRDPALLLELDRDPHGVARRAGLSPNEESALLTRMPGRIWVAIEAA